MSVYTKSILPPRATVTGPKVFTRSKGIIRKAWKTGIYGPEGIGKSSLASFCPSVAFIDLEHSTRDMDVERVDGVDSWFDLRAFVKGVNPSDFPVVCIDSVTRAEEWCMDYVIQNKSSNEGVKAKDSIEDWKYKAGITFIVEEFRRFLADIEEAFLRGVSFILVAHNRIGRVRNPDGSDFIRAEPRLLHDEKGSNMLAWIQFLDHLLFVDSDIMAEKGKAKGGGSRTIYTQATPSRMAKSRTLPDEPIVYGKGDGRVWDLINGKEAVVDGPPI